MFSHLNMFFTLKLAAALLFVAGLDAAAFRTPRYAMERHIGSCPMSSSEESSCGEVCILGYQGPSCNIAVGYAKIEDSMGFMMPLNWTMYTTDTVQINSISYSGPTRKNTNRCKATRFSFHGRIPYAGVMVEVASSYLTPGQSGRECFDFGNASVTDYDGVNLYIDAPAYLTRTGL
ncbi:hypothetical protein ACEPPN_006500 [Leptodophora sp. 'Broadleaf-Isolate-01']